MLEQLAGWITTTIDHPGYPGVLAVLAVLYYVHRLRAAGGGSPGGAVPG